MIPDKKDTFVKGFFRYSGGSGKSRSSLVGEGRSPGLGKTQLDEEERNSESHLEGGDSARLIFVRSGLSENKDWDFHALSIPSILKICNRNASLELCWIGKAPFAKLKSVFRKVRHRCDEGVGVGGAHI